MSDHHFHHIITLSSGKSYTLENLTQENLSETCQVLSKAYCSGDPICKAANLDEDTFYQLCKNVCQISLLDNLGVVCKENETNKIIGACIVCDNIRDLHDAEHFKNIKHAALYDVSVLTNQFKTTFPLTQRGEKLCIYLLGTTPNIKEDNLAYEILKWVILLHPIISKAMVTYMYCTSPWSIKAAKELCLKTIETIDPSTIVNSKGEKPFDTFKESLSKLNLEGYEGVCLVKRDRQELLDELFDIDFSKQIE